MTDAVDGIDAEERVSAQHFVGAFTGEHDFDAGVSHRPAEQVLGDAVAVEHLRFAVPDRGCEGLRDVKSGDRDRVVGRADEFRLSLGDLRFVIEGVREG